MENKLTAPEAIYGFAAWLTTRKERTIMSWSDDCAPIIDLIERFCKENNLDQNLRGNWTSYLSFPDETIEEEKLIYMGE